MRTTRTRILVALTALTLAACGGPASELGSQGGALDGDAEQAHAGSGGSNALSGDATAPAAPEETSTDDAPAGETEAPAEETTEPVAEAPSAPEEAPTAPAPVLETYALRYSDSLGEAPAWSSSFFVTDTYSLFIALDIPTAAKGRHTATFFVQAPGGASYQRIDIRFAAAIQATTGEQQAEALATGGYRIWASIPVAGTMIEQYGIVGTWSVAAHIDGSNTPKAKASVELL